MVLEKIGRMRGRGSPGIVVLTLAVAGACRSSAGGAAGGEPADGSTPGGGANDAAAPGDGPAGSADDLTCAAPPGAWQAMATAGAPAGLVSPLLFWTGKEALAYGNTSAGFAMAAYDPCAGRWRSTALPAPGRPLGVGMPVGGQLLFLSVASSGLQRFAAYDFVGDHWREAHTEGAHADLFAAELSTGAQLVRWGGAHSTNPASAAAPWSGSNEGAIYDPATDRWRAITTTGAPSPRIAPAAWTGDRVAVWGGKVADSVSTAGGARVDCYLPGALLDECGRFGDGALYDPKADRWTPMASAGAPAARHSHLLAWTGSRLLVWGGRDAGASASKQEGDLFIDGALYDPAAQAWRAMAPAPVPATQASAYTAWWTGTRLAVIGNGGDAGWLYDPGADAWSELPGGATCERGLRAQAGGLAGSCQRDTRQVGLVLPAGAARWAEYPLPDMAPIASEPLWTGKRLFVWGGRPASWTTGCEHAPPGVGCDPAAPPASNQGWVLAP